MIPDIQFHNWDLQVQATTTYHLPWLRGETLKCVRQINPFHDMSLRFRLQQPILAACTRVSHSGSCHGVKMQHVRNLIAERPGIPARCLRTRLSHSAMSHPIAQRVRCNEHRTTYHCRDRQTRFAGVNTHNRLETRAACSASRDQDTKIESISYPGNCCRHDACIWRRVPVHVNSCQDWIE